MCPRRQIAQLKFSEQSYVVQNFIWGAVLETISCFVIPFNLGFLILVSLQVYIRVYLQTIKDEYSVNS